MIETRNKSGLLTALDMSRYSAISETIEIRNGTFIIHLKPVDSAGEWIKTASRARDKALLKLIARIKQQPQSLFEVE